MIGKIALLFLLGCWEKTGTEKDTGQIDAPISEPSTEEPPVETAPEPEPDTEIDPDTDTAIDPDTDSAEETNEDTTSQQFPCAEDFCQEQEYCYQFYPGVFDTAGPPDPYCEELPAECLENRTCECLSALGICTDCQQDRDGLYCTLAGAK